MSTLKISFSVPTESALRAYVKKKGLKFATSTCSANLREDGENCPGRFSDLFAIGVDAISPPSEDLFWFHKS